MKPAQIDDKIYSETSAEWCVSGKLIPYPEAVSFMEARAAAIAAGEASERVWLLEHPPLYTACLLYTSPSPRDGLLSRMPSSA